jgi:hypothetical protein
MLIQLFIYVHNKSPKGQQHIKIKNYRYVLLIDSEGIGNTTNGPMSHA